MAEKVYEVRTTFAHWWEDACEDLISFYESLECDVHNPDLSVFLEHGVEVGLKEVQDDKQSG